MVPREYRLCFSLSALLIFALFFVYVVVSSCVLYILYVLLWTVWEYVTLICACVYILK